MWPERTDLVGGVGLSGGYHALPGSQRAVLPLPTLLDLRRAVKELLDEESRFQQLELANAGKDICRLIDDRRWLDFAVGEALFVKAG